jgi:hypothetical protein
MGDLIFMKEWKERKRKELNEKYHQKGKSVSEKIRSALMKWGSNTGIARRKRNEDGTPIKDQKDEGSECL